jgi:SAM-dependent methyltransferase
MDIEKGLEFSDATFDMVFCSEVIEHMVNPENLVKEIYRVLRPEGKLLLSTPNSAFWVYRVASLLGYTLSELQHPKHFIFFSRRSLRQLVQKEGFLPISETGRNMYAILPDPRMGLLHRLLSLLGFRQEMRFRTGSNFWHLSHHSGFLNSFFSDTLILMAKKLDLKDVVG